MLDAAGREIEDTVEQCGQFGGQLTGLAGLRHDVFEVAGAGRMLHVVHGFDAQGAQQQVRGRVEQLDQPAEQLQVPGGGQSEAPGDRFGAGDGEVLREQFAEDHLDDGGGQDGQHGADCDPDRGRDAAAGEQVPDATADQRFGDVADQQPGDGDAELCARQHERGAAGDRQRLGRGLVPGRGAGLEPGAVHGHVREFLGHEVAGDRGDGHDHQQAQQDAEDAQHGGAEVEPESWSG